MTPPGETRHETVGANLVRRMRRLQLGRVQPAVLPWVILCWSLTAGFVVVTAWPGALAGITGAPVDAAGGLVGFDAPLWLRVLVTLAGAALAGAAAVVLKTRAAIAPERPAMSLRAELAIGGLLLVPLLGLLADHAWLFAVPAVLLAAAAELFLHTAAPRLFAALTSAGVWLVLLAYQFTEPGAARGSWVWIAFFGGAAAFAAFGTYYGVARAAESRSRALGFLFRERWHPIAVLVAVLAATVVVVLRLTVLRELFAAPDPQLWSPWSRSPVSWGLAALVAAVLVAVAVRSTRHPLLRVGQRRVTAGLAILGNLHLVLAGLLIVIGLVTAIAGAVVVPQEWLGAVPVLRVAGVALLGLAVLLPVFRGTAARWLVIVAVLFLLPNTIERALDDGSTFAPTPAQVTILLVLVALVFAVLNLIRPTVRPSLVARLAIVPIVAVHAGWLLPVVWSHLGLVLGVLGLIVAFLLLQPPADPDGRVHSERLLTRAALQLLGFGIGITAAPSLLDSPGLVVLGLIWLSVVVVAALCFETVPPQSVSSSNAGSDPAIASTEPTDQQKTAE